MFEGYRIYKNWDKRTGRWFASMHNTKTKHYTSMSWARYLMTLHLGRMLEDWEQVDHINNDKTDDRIENFQILTNLENCRKSAKGKTMVTLTCPWCKIEFTRERNKTHLIKGGRPTCCSRSCGAKRGWNN